MYFSRSQLSHFLFLWIDPFFRLNEENFTFHLQYKRSGTFSKRKYEELSYLQKSENVQPHSNDSIENATRSSGTSQLASYKEVPPPPHPGNWPKPAISAWHAPLDYGNRNRVTNLIPGQTFKTCSQNGTPTLDHLAALATSYRAEYLRILCNQLDPNKDESTDNRVFDSELNGTAIP